MLNELVSGVGLLAITIYGGGWLLEQYEARRDRKHYKPVVSTPPEVPVGQSALVEEFLETLPVEVRLKLAGMSEETRLGMLDVVHETAAQVRAIDQWLEAVKGWAPHQRASVESMAVAKVEERTRVIIDLVNLIASGGPLQADS